MLIGLFSNRVQITEDNGNIRSFPTGTGTFNYVNGQVRFFSESEKYIFPQFDTIDTITDNTQTPAVDLSLPISSEALYNTLAPFFFRKLNTSGQAIQESTSEDATNASTTVSNSYISPRRLWEALTAVYGELSQYLPTAARNAPFGVAGLDEDGKLESTFPQSYIDALFLANPTLWENLQGSLYDNTQLANALQDLGIIDQFLIDSKQDLVFVDEKTDNDLKINTQIFAYVVASDSSLNIPTNAALVYYCDGIGDEVEINAALAAYQLVILSDGNFNIANTIVGANSLIGAGQSLTTINMATALQNGIRIGGSKTQIGADNPIQNVTANQKNITTVADRTASISPNDFICLADNNLWHNQRSNYLNGEFAQVASITPTTITTVENIWLNYNGSIKRLYRYNFSIDKKLGGFKIVYGATAVGGVIVRMQVARNSQIFDLHIDGNTANKSARLGLELNECLNCTADNIKVDYVQHLGQASPQGYGIYANNSKDITVTKVTGTQNKHLVDTDKSSDLNGSGYCPISRSIIFKNIKATSNQGVGNGAAFSSHGGAENVVFEDCRMNIYDADVDNGFNSAFLIRSVKTTIRKAVLNFRIANTYINGIIRVGENSSVGGVLAGVGRAAEDLIIQDIIINVSSTTSFTSTTAGEVISIRTDAKNALIQNVKSTGLQGNIFFFEGADNNGVIIENCNIAAAPQLTGKKIVQVTPQTGALPAVNFTFRNNIITGANDTVAPHIESTTGTTNPIETGNTVS